MTFPQKSSEPALFFIILVGVAVWRGAPAKDTAFVEVVLFESSPSGDYTTYTTGLQGRFSKAGATTSAEGEIVQVHPLGLCNSNNEEDLFDYGWVGVVKLEQPHLDPSCLSVLGKTKRAVQRGATAVILDVSEDPGAIDQLDRGSNDPLKRPVVFVKGGDAVKLMNIVNKQKVAWARIQHQPPQQPAEYFDTGVFLAFFMAVSLVCLLVLIRIKLKQRRAQGPVNRAAVRALEKMETRHFKAKGQRDSASVAADSICGSSASDCAICLERYLDGEELRVISCTHRFHRRCVDPWLLEHHTCPHCRCNIIEQKGNFSSTCVSSGVPAHGRRQRVALSILHPGSVHHMAPTPLTATRVGPHTNLVTATTTFGHTDRTRCPPQVSAWLHGCPPICLDRPISQVGGAPSRLLRFCSQPARVFTQPAGGFHQPRGPFYQSSAYTSAFKRSRPHGRSFPRASCFSPNETLYQHYYDRGLTFPQAPGRTGLAPERPPDLLCPTVLHRSFALAAHSCLGPAHTCYHGNDSVCSGYLGDGLGSDSSSGAHCGRGRSSSNDSVLDSTEISTQGMFGSSSTFRSSLSSDYDPYVYRSRSPGGGPELDVGNGTPPAHRGYCSLDHSTKIELRERNSTTPPGALGGTRVDFASLAPDYRGGHSVAYGCHFEILPAASQEKCHHLGEPKFLEMFDNGQCVQELWTEASTACSSCNVSLVDRGNQEGHTCGSLGKDQLGWDSRQCCCARLSTTSDQAQPGTDGAQNLCGAGRQNHKMPQHVRPDLQHAVQRGGEEVCGVYRAVADDGDPSGSNESLMAGFHPALGERQTAGEDLKVLLT